MNAFPTGFAAVGNGFIRSGACVGLVTPSSTASGPPSPLYKFDLSKSEIWNLTYPQGEGFKGSVGLAPAALCVGANCVRLRTVREAGPYEGLQGRFAGERLPLEGKLAAVRLTDEVF